MTDDLLLMKGMKATTSRRPNARDYCRSIVNLMALTERGRKRDSVVVCIGSDLWKRIYLNARKGAKT